MNSIEETDLDRRLSALHRAPSVDPQVLDRLALEAQHFGRGQFRRRLTVFGLSVMVVIGGGLIAAPAGADAVREFLALSDWDPDDGGENLAASDWVDLSADDLHDYIDYIFPEWIPIPPSMTRADIVDRTYEISYQANTLTQEVSLRRSIETFAYCGWAVELIDAERHGNAERYDRAAEIVLSAADWPALVATDGGGITDRLREAGTAAVAGEANSGLNVYAVGECSILGVDSGFDQ